jgi:NADH-quinone oxidoreductase subunit M
MAYGPIHDEHRALPDVSLREVLVLAPILSLLLVFGVYPKLLTDRIDPTTHAVIAHVNPAHPTDVGAVTVALPGGEAP